MTEKTMGEIIIMNRITYQPTALSKQVWFYGGVLYLILSTIMYIMIEVYQVPEFAENVNLTVALIANVLGIVFFILLSQGHKVCYTDFDEEKAVYHNRLTRKEITFYYKDATSIIFDKKGAKFYNSHEDLVSKKKPLFMIPFFRDGKVNVLPLDEFYKLMKKREEEIADTEKFSVYRTYKVVPGYSRNWKYISFAYACLALLVILNCSKPLAAIIGLMAAF